MRIVSLLPSATEILYALGLGDNVGGVSHECDFPEDAKKKPAVISARVGPRLPSAEIDTQVARILARGESLYQVHDDLLRKLKPDLIVTQDLCHVCAASPGYLVDVFEDVRRVGIATEHERAAEVVAQNLHDRVEHVHEVATKHRPKPRVG